MNKIEVIQGDITALNVDTIVNAANSRLAGGGGVDGAIHRAAGQQLIKACRDIIQEIQECPAGQAVLTPGFTLQAKYIIHTVGPIWRGGNNEEQDLLASAYYKSLTIAHDKKVSTIAFPNISTGVYGYPKQEAAQTALSTVSNFIQEYPDTSLEKIIFVCFDNENYGIYQRLL